MLEDIIINKKGFPFYTDYWDKYFNDMSGDQVKECLKIIFHYNKTFEILDTKDLAVKMVRNTIIYNINRDAKKREKQNKANIENGKKGGRPKNTEAKQKQTKSKPEANKKDKELKNINKKGFIKPTLEEVEEYNNSRGGYVDAKKFYDYYEAGHWEDQQGNKVKNWKQKLITWEKNTTKTNSGDSFDRVLKEIQSEQLKLK